MSENSHEDTLNTSDETETVTEPSTAPEIPADPHDDPDYEEPKHDQGSKTDTEGSTVEF